jgi:hypothetical protein
VVGSVIKYRRPAFTGTTLICCENLIRQICAGIAAELREYNGEAGLPPAAAHRCPGRAARADGRVAFSWASNGRASGKEGSVKPGYGEFLGRGVVLAQ